MSSDLNWGRMTLKQAGVTLIDCDHSTPPAADFGYPYIAIPQLKNGRIELEGVRRISAEDFALWTKKLKPQVDDVVVVRRCNSGDSAVIPKGLDCAIGQNLVVLRSDGKKIYPGFLRWLIRSPDWWEQVSKYINVGAVFDSLKCREIPHFELTIPPMAAQKEIALLFGGLDDRITLLRETNATLEAIAQALFKSWFVDFDPVRAKAEGLEPQAMDAPTAALFPDSFEESELGLVPKGWQIKPLGAVCSFQKGCSYKGAGLSDSSGAYMFNLGCFNAPRVYAFEKLKRYTGDYKQKHSVVPGDLIMANTDMTQERVILGRALIIPEGFLPGFVSHHVFKIGIEESSRFELTPYLFLSFLQREFREKVVGHATGSVVLALPKDALVNHEIIIPSKSIMQVFSGIVSPLFLAIHENELKAQTLTQLRDTLLPRLISGQLRLPEAKSLLEKAL